MKKLLRAISCFLCTVLLFSVLPTPLTAHAAVKNTTKTSISKIEPKAKAFKVTWKKKTKVKGYQIQYSTSSKFKKAKTKTIAKAKKNSATISKLKGCNVKYYVRVRTYKITNGKKVYSAWSKTKKITTLNHKYSKATCTAAKTCKYCKKTRGWELDHDWDFATCTEPMTCLLCKETIGEAIGHNWKDATCTDPKTCWICKETSGSALGHDWEEATCTTAKACKTCGVTLGVALNHDWEEATCTTAKTCKACGETVGVVLGHDWSNWSTIVSPEVGKTGIDKRTCSVCSQLEIQEIPALEEDFTKLWFVNQYNIATQQYIHELSKSKGEKQSKIEENTEAASALWVSYKLEEKRIMERYPASGTRDVMLNTAYQNWYNSARVYTENNTALEEEIAAIDAEINSPNVDNILAIVTKNCNISSREVYEYYYKYFTCI